MNPVLVRLSPIRCYLALDYFYALAVPAALAENRRLG